MHLKYKIIAFDVLWIFFILIKWLNEHVELHLLLRHSFSIDIVQFCWETKKKLSKRSKCLDLIIALVAELRPYLSREIRDRRKAEQSRLTT